MAGKSHSGKFKMENEKQQQLCEDDRASLPSLNGIECAKEPANSCREEDKDKICAIASADNGFIPEATEEIDGASFTSEIGTNFDILRFKNNFLKMVEELRLRRHLNSENEHQIESLLMEKHELSHKLDEAVSFNRKLTESHSCEIQDLVKKNEEQIQQYRNDQAKYSMMQDSREQELKALKDEMKALHLTKHVLEKKVQEQERQIQLQNSFRENYQTKMTQLEEKCSSLQKLADDTSEEVSSLDGSVQQAKTLHQKLAYVNQHQNCELAAVRRQLEACRQELVESRAQRRDSDVGSGSNEGRRDSEAIQAKQKATEQELRMQVELCKHVQSQLQSLRGEHQEVLQQLKEAHTLLERHVDTATKAMEGQEDLKSKLELLKAEVERLEAKSALVEEDLRQKEESYTHDREVWNEKMGDTEHRLTTLQSDYKLLQDSYDSIQASKLTMEKNHLVEIEQLKSKCRDTEREREIFEESNRELKAVESNLKEQIGNLQHALDQSELQLAKTEKELQLKDSGKVENEECLLVVSGRECSTQFSPEVISSVSGDDISDPCAKQVNSATTEGAISAPISSAVPKTSLPPATPSTTNIITLPQETCPATPPTTAPCETCPVSPPCTDTTVVPRDTMPATPPTGSALIPTFSAASPPTTATIDSLQETPPLTVSSITSALPPQDLSTLVSDTVSSITNVALPRDSPTIASDSAPLHPPSPALDQPNYDTSTLVLNRTPEKSASSDEANRNINSQEHNIGPPNAKRLKLALGPTSAVETTTPAPTTAPDSTPDQPPTAPAVPGSFPAKCGDQGLKDKRDEVEILVKEVMEAGGDEENVGGAGEGAENEGGAPEGDMCILFSPESDGGKEESMLSTQINKQIQRVEMFLKMDRLRKRK